ncbi:MAG: hypothetical protein ACXVAY_16995, partial [Mucilaginibacter sp.]
PANPDANTANWGTGVSLLTITASAKSVGGRIDPSVEESRILVIIKKGGSKICGIYTSSNAPAANFNSMTKVWSGSNATALLGQDCTLPPGDYELSVQFFGYSLAKQAPISEEKTKPFTIRGNDQQAYQPPQLIVPARGTLFKDEDIKKPITFRWTPVTPRPATPVTYRLSVWQLMVGQTGPQAIRANQPIFTKDVENLTQAVVSNVINGPCKPPYMCSYIWSVQALDREGKPIGGNNGTSEVNDFQYNEKSLSPAIKIDTLIFACSSYGNYTYTLKVENPGSGQFSATAITFASPGGGITNLTMSPSIPMSINSGSGNAVNITGSFSYTGTTYPTTVIAKISGNQAGNPLLTSSDTEMDSLKICLCKDCDRSSITFNPTSISPTTSNSNQYNIAGNINVSGLPGVYGVELQVQSYNYTSSPETCTNGVTGTEQSEMFMRPGTTINNASNIQMYNETVSGSSTTENNAAKNVKLTSTSPLPNSIPVNLVIGLPGPIAGLNKDCCKIQYNLCVRIKVFYDKDACKSCEYTYCFPSFSNQ